MKILVVGLYWSGSSAVFDWLKGFEEVEIVPGEFDVFRRPDKIVSIITANSVEEKTTTALKFLKKLKQQQLRKKIVNDKNLARIKNAAKIIVNKLTNKNYKKANINAIKFDESSYAISTTIKYLNDYLLILDKKNFNEIYFWKKWLDKILLPYTKSNKLVVLDQPVFLTSHSKIWSQLFSDFKIILIHRNPADQFAEVLRQEVAHIKRGYLVDHFSTNNYYNENDLAVSFANMLEDKYGKILKFKEEFKHSLISLSFEDFIQNHSKESLILKEKLNLKNQTKTTAFNPAKSIKNIGIANQDWAKEQISKKGYSLLHKVNNTRNLL